MERSPRDPVNPPSASPSTPPSTPPSTLRPTSPPAKVVPADEIHQLRARLSAIVEDSDDAIVSKSLDGTIRSWNAAAERLFGYTAQEAIGKPITLIIPPELHSEERDILARIISGEKVDHFETVRITRGGRRLHVSLTVSPIRDAAGRVAGASKIARDITWSRLASQQRALLSSIVDASSDIIISKSLDGTIRSWNGAAARLFGYSAEEAIGQPITLIIPPELRAEEAAILERLKRGERIDHFETVRVARDGRVVELSVTVSPIRADDGRIVGASKVGRDITDRVSAERALRRNLQELERFVAMTTADLQDPLRELCRLATAAAEEAAGLGPGARARLAQISDLSARLCDTVGRLPQYARIGSEQEEVACDLDAIARRAIDRATDGMDLREVVVTQVSGLPPVMGDPLLLERVLFNLVSNGIRHNHSPVKRVEVGTEGGLVFVRDNGPGIHPRLHDRVFTMFSRLASAGAGAGVGLGLALVKNIMETHGGRVWIDSAPGSGATFYLAFPSAPRRQPPSPPVSSADDHPARPTE